MYVPKIFENSDQRASLDLMNQHGFATIVMHTHDGLLANHLPHQMGRMSRLGITPWSMHTEDRR